MRKWLLKTLIISALTLTMTASIAFAAPILKKDSHGHDVLVLQQRLQERSDDISTKRNGLLKILHTCLHTITG